MLSAKRMTFTGWFAFVAFGLLNFQEINPGYEVGEKNFQQEKFDHFVWILSLGLLLRFSWYFVFPNSDLEYDVY